jgi:hypothetical protein
LELLSGKKSKGENKPCEHPDLTETGSSGFLTTSSKKLEKFFIGTKMGGRFRQASKATLKYQNTLDEWVKGLSGWRQKKKQ